MQRRVSQWLTSFTILVEPINWIEMSWFVCASPSLAFVIFHTADLLNLGVDLVFYDTTTASFSVDEADEESDELGAGLRQWGKPKEGGWAVQVVVALAVTRGGLPVRCWVFPGKTTDVKTVEKIKADLRGWKLNRALFVADAGMNSRENRAELGRA
jgi:transposase